MDQIVNHFNNKSILITGGGGYLGSKLVEKLSNTTANILIIDLVLNHVSARLLKNFRNVQFMNIDLLDYSALKVACDYIKPDLIFHFAALMDRQRDFSSYKKIYDVNVQGTLNLLEALNAHTYQSFFFSSTAEVYGIKNKSPFREDQIPSPVSSYSLTKLMAENLISTYSVNYDKPYTILRMFNFHGDDMPENFFLSQLVYSLMHDKDFRMTGGKQFRDYMHIDTLIDIIVRLASTEKSIYQTINVCSGKGKNIYEIAVEMAKSQNKLHLLKIGTLDYRKNEIWELVGDNTKLKNILSMKSIKYL